MVSQIHGAQPVTALVVDNDPSARQKICNILIQKGIEVREASSLSQGQDCFDSQPIVLARAPDDGSGLNGFVDWVRLHAGNSQPYIVAIDDGEATDDAMEDAASNPGCNAVMHAPVEKEAIEERLLAIDAWLEERYPETREPETSEEEAPGAPAAGGLPIPVALVAKPHTRDQQAAYSSVLVENAPVAMAMFDDEMRYLVANRKWHKEFHLENVSLNGRSHYDVFPALPENWRRLLDRCLREGVAERCQEDLFERPDGTTDWVRWEVRPWRRAEGTVGGLIITTEVITELRMREKRSRFDREFTASLLNSGTAPVMLIDFDGKVVQQNFASMALFQPAGPGKGQTFYWDLINEAEDVQKERDAFLKAVEVLRETGRYDAPAPTRTRIAPKENGGAEGSNGSNGSNGENGSNGASTGAGRRFAWSMMPHVNEHGVVEAFIRLGIEIAPEDLNAPEPAAAAPEAPETELPPLSPEAQPVAVGSLSREDWKAKEKKLIAQRDFFQQIPEHAPLGMMLVDREGGVVYSNPQHKAVLGFDVAESEDVEGWLVRGCPEEDYAAEVLETWRDSVWRKQLPKTFTLATDEGLLKEIEFRPTLLADGKLLLTFADITETHRIEEAFRASEAKFRALFQGSRVGMALVDKSGDFFDINSALETMLGYPRWEMRSKSLSACLYPDDLPAFEELERAIEEDDPSVNEIEARFIAKEGALLWVRLNASPVRDHAGNLLFIAYTVHDISSHKRAWRETDDGGKGGPRAVLDVMPDLVLLFDENGVIADMIPSSKKFLSLDPDRVLRDGIGRDLPKLEENLGALIAEARENERGTARYEFTATGEDDETRHLEARVLNCDGGQTLVMVGDIADRDSSREDLTRKALAFENLRDAIVMTDVKGRITDFNPAAEAFFGYSESEIAGKPLYTLYEPTDPRAFNRRISEEINAKAQWSGETGFRRKDGTEGVCDVLFFPVKCREGDSKSLIGVSRPVEERVGAAEGAEGAEAAAEAPAESLVDVGEQVHEALRGMHHRVNNDLQVISSLLNLQLGALPEEAGRRVLKQHQNRILAISFIHRLLARSADRDSVDFSEFMVSLVEHLGKSFGIDEDVIEVHLTFGKLRLDVEKAVPLGLIANELVCNAFQHAFPENRQGIVKLGFERSNGDGILKISDNGVGLPMAFDLEAPPTLGLQVVKILVKQLDGGIELAESPDTEFHVRFPAGGG